MKKKPIAISRIQPNHSWVVVMTAALFFLYQFIQMSMFNALSPALIASFHIDATVLGYVSASFFGAIVILALPAGILSDMYPARRLLLISLAISILGSLVMSIASSLWIFTIGRVMTGIAHAFCFINIIRLACQYFPPRRRATITGLIVTIGMLGGMLSQTPLTYLLHHTSWQNALQFNGLLGLILWLTFWLVVFDNDAVPQPHPCLEAELKTVRHQLKTVLRNKQNWLAGSYTGLLNLPILVLGALWGNLYLTSKGLSTEMATFICSMIYLGTIIGSPVIGWLSDHYHTRLIPMKFGAITSFILFCAILLLPINNPHILTLLFFLLGVTSSSQVISYPLISASNPPPLVASALSISTMLIMGAGMLFQPVIGMLLDFCKQLHKHLSYEAIDFQQAFFVIALSFLISLWCCYRLQEQHSH